MQVKRLKKASSFEDKIATYSSDDQDMEMNESESGASDNDDENLSENSGSEDDEQAGHSVSDADDGNDDSDMQTEDLEDEEEDGDNSDGQSEDSESEGNTSSEAVGNAGWADAISKVLKTNKPRSKKTLVLSRARKINDPKYNVEVKDDPGFEVEGEEKLKTEPVEPKISSAKEKELKRKRKAWENLCRVKPDILQKDRERALTKIATKGVVQLFNAVRQQQKTIETGFKAAGGSERRKEKVLKAVDKNSFLDILMGPTKSAVISHGSKPEEDVKPTVKLEEDDNKAPLWSVLRDDFLVGGKLKDWDRAPDGDAEGSGEERSSDNEASDGSGGSDSE